MVLSQFQLKTKFVIPVSSCCTRSCRNRCCRAQEVSQLLIFYLSPVHIHVLYRSCITFQRTLEIPHPSHLISIKYSLLLRIPFKIRNFQVYGSFVAGPREPRLVRAAADVRGRAAARAAGGLRGPEPGGPGGERS